MKRSLDSMLEIPKQQEEDRLKLSTVYESDQINYSMVDRQTITKNWISECDHLLLSDQHYGDDVIPLGLYAHGIISAAECASYYKVNLIHKDSDILLCQGVCPVFILHGIASMLRYQPLSNGHISYYWQFALHILKKKLVAAGKPIGPFISRLFDLVYVDGLTPYEIPEIYINIITIFLHENLQFMIKRDPPKPGASQYYTLSAEAIENPTDITSIVINNLLPIYFIITDSHAEALNTSGSTSQNEAIALWNKHQLDRGTMRDMPLFTGNLCPIPQKKIRAALKTVRFDDRVSTMRYISYVHDKK